MAMRAEGKTAHPVLHVAALTSTLGQILARAASGSASKQRWRGKTGVTPSHVTTDGRTDHRRQADTCS